MLTKSNEFTSPFPRKMSNEKFKSSFNKAQLIKDSFNDKSNHKSLVKEINHDLTKSYMSNNPYYFKLQSYKTSRGISPSKNSKCNKNTKLSKGSIHKQEPIIIEKEKLNNLLDNKLNKIMQPIIKTHFNKEISPNKIKTAYNNKKYDKEYMASLINRPKTSFNSNLNKNFGKVPD